MTEDIRFDYTIEGAQPEYTVIISPADGSTVKGEQLYEITVTFDGAKAIELNGDQATSLYQLDENGNPIANIYQNMSVEGNVAKFTVMELHKPYLNAAGTFQFTIPVGMVTITDNNDVVGKNKENIVATYLHKIMHMRINEIESAIEMGYLVALIESEHFGTDPKKGAKRLFRVQSCAAEAINEAYGHSCIDSAGFWNSYDGCGLERLQGRLANLGVEYEPKCK
jgi:hypothetical protein